jgi:hypothetical protein
MSNPATDTTLWDWRYGQTQAERLCADILQTEGYDDVDPQCPLGGPDDRKDILCTRGGENWLAAAYFPPTRSEFKDVADKFQYDFEGVARHNAYGFAFFTNQPITPGQRAELARIAAPTATEIYHQERIRSILDSPKGYGLRLEYLRIPMTEEEQHSLWSTLKDDITERLRRQEEGLIDLHRKMDLVMARTMEMASNLRLGASSMDTPPLPRLAYFPTADLHLGDVLWIHRIVCDGTSLPNASRGRFRNVAVWIGQPGTTPDNARFVPVPPEEIRPRMESLLDNWRKTYPVASGSSESERIAAVAAFHHGMLTIHPFLDGNGRVARALLQQQVFEFTGRYVTADFTEVPAEYFQALSAADKGNPLPLQELIKANLE